MYYNDEICISISLKADCQVVNHTVIYLEEASLATSLAIIQDKKRRQLRLQRTILWQMMTLICRISQKCQEKYSRKLLCAVMSDKAKLTQDRAVRKRDLSLYTTLSSLSCHLHSNTRNISTNSKTLQSKKQSRNCYGGDRFGFETSITIWAVKEVCQASYKFSRPSSLAAAS